MISVPDEEMNSWDMICWQVGDEMMYVVPWHTRDYSSSLHERWPERPSLTRMEHVLSEIIKIDELKPVEEPIGR